MSQPSDTKPDSSTAEAPQSPAPSLRERVSSGLHKLEERVEAKVNTLEEKVEDFFSREAPADLYRYNYTKLAPLALIDELPRQEKPRLNWYLHAALLSLRTARNRLVSAEHEARAATQAASGEHDLSHVGLGKVNLHELSLDAVSAEHVDALDGDALERAHEAGEEQLPGAHEERIPLRLLRTLVHIARTALKRGIKDPMGMLRLVLESVRESPRGRPHTLADYQGLFGTFKRPWFADRWEDDDVFAYLRVAGFNPLVLQRVAAPGPKFPVTDEHFRAGMGDAGDSLARAGAEGRLFLCDYEALAKVKQGNFPAGPKYGFAPLALFALPRGTGTRRLRPVAIQCGQDSRVHRVFTPADGEAWRRAKIVVSVADFNHHEMISHLGRTHLLIGPMPIALHRHLPEGHPVRTLLEPHFEGLLAINDLAQATLVAPGHEVDQSLAGTIEASRALAVEGLHAKPFNALFLPVELEARGVGGPELDYPYRDDASAVWGAIERWVGDYVALYYPTDAAVQADAALQAWAAELLAQDGGRLQGLGDAGDGRFQTVAYLARALTMIVFTSSAQHAAVNFPQADLLSFAPATPPAAYRAAPLSPEDAALSDVLDYFPPLEMAQLQMDFLNMLGGVYYTTLGQYDARWFKKDARVAPLLARFQQELRDLEVVIAQRNTGRLGPYPFLLPSRIPQSINI